MQVKEATQRCHDLGIGYDFAQTQVADEFGQLAVVVNVIDRRGKRIAQWPTTRLNAWLDEIRANEDITSSNAFDMFDIDWLERSDCVDLSDSMNSSRISLDVSAIKNALLSQPAKGGLETFRTKLSPWTENRTSPNILHTKKKLTYDELTEAEESTESKKANSTPQADSFEAQAQNYLRELRKTTLRFKKLCHQNANENADEAKAKVASKILNSVEEMESLTNDIRKMLKRTTTEDQTPSRKMPKSVRFILD